MTYAETLKALWRMIGEETRVSVVVDGATLASFHVAILEPPVIPKLPWSRAKTLPAPGPDRLSAWLSEDAFVSADYVHAGEALRVRLRNGIELIFAAPAP